MALVCNIDARGKAVRLVIGLALLVAAGASVFAWALASGSWVAWVVSGLLAVAGALGVFEARAGWCVLRSLGIRTPV